MTYYCKTCEQKIGLWNNEDKQIYVYFCEESLSREYFSTFFLKCEKCKTFVGIQCYDVCKNCFGENEILGEENLKKWFMIHKKSMKRQKINHRKKICSICENIKKERDQIWFFKDQTKIE